MNNLNVDFCFTCLKVFPEKENLISLSLETSQEITYRKKLKSCVPEMIVQNTDDCFLCTSCSEALETAYNFRCLCLSTEHKLHQYRATKQQNLKDIYSIREDLLQVLSRESNEIEKNDLTVTPATKLESVLTETSVTEESNIHFDIKPDLDEIITEDIQPLTDDQLISKACKTLPELKNIPEAALNCNVALEKIVIKDLPVIIPGAANVKQKSPFYCAICNVVIKKRERFYSHMLRHSNIKGYKCEECTAAYFSADSLRQHKKTAHLIFPNVPNQTNKINKVKKAIAPVTIKQEHRPEKGKQKPKGKCILKIKLPTKTKKAKVVHNSVNDKNFHCNYCEYQTTLKHLFDRHSLKHSGSEAYPCALCPKVYSAQWALNRHIRSIHNVSVNGSPTRKHKKMPTPIQIKQEIIDNKDEVICTICTAKFSSEPEYKTHLKTHTEICEPESPPKTKLKPKKKKKKYYCPVCKSEFSTRDHANIHSGEKPYTCNVCAKTFAAYTTLRKHRYTHNLNSSTNRKSNKKHKCEICKVELENEADLYSHNCQTTSGELIYRCQICKDPYLGRSALIEHMRIHIEQN